MKEQEIVIKGKGCNLSGTLLIPNNDDKPLPLVIIMVGSGPVDRNGNGGAIDLNVYNKIAQELYKNGIASFRYDKRGVGKSKTSDSYLFLRTGMHDLLDDLETCAVEVMKDPRINKDGIFILGHSEGAILMPLIFQKVSRR